MGFHTSEGIFGLGRPVRTAIDQFRFGRAAAGQGPNSITTSGFNFDNPPNQDIANLETTRLATQEAAGGLLSGGLADIQSSFQPVFESANALSITPFSEALEKQLLQVINDRITGQSQQQFQEAAISRGRRGLSAGGSTSQTAAGGILSEALDLRTGATANVAFEQSRINTEAERFKADILGRITGLEQSLSNPLRALQAQIKSGEDTILADTFGIEEGRRMFDELQRLLDEAEPTQRDKILDALPLIFQILRPSADRFIAGSQLPGIFDLGG